MKRTQLSVSNLQKHVFVNVLFATWGRKRPLFCNLLSGCLLVRLLVYTRLTCLVLIKVTATPLDVLVCCVSLSHYLAT